MPITLRPYQIDLKAAIYGAWNSGIKNVLAQKPTGMGKTKTFCSIAYDMAIDPKGPRLPTAIMVHRKELVQQISLTLAEEGIKHNIIAPRNVIQGIVAAQRIEFKKQFYDYNAPVTVVSVDTLNARIDKHDRWVPTIKLWITDEAAHVLRDNKWGRAIKNFTNAIGLGVTATPERLDKRGLGSHADGVFDVMVSGPAVRWGIENGFLSKYKIAVPLSDFNGYLHKASEGSDYSKEAMMLASQKSSIIGDMVTNYKKFADGKQAIAFVTDIGTGYKVEKAFIDAGVSAKLLTGETKDSERLQALIDYRNKKIQVLLNVDLFDEGLDVPGIECVIMGRPTMSLGKYLQMIGRGLRVMKGKDFCIIIDHVGNVSRHGLPDQPRTWTLDRIVKRRDKTNLIRICHNHECNSPYDRILTECPYCGEPIPRPKPSEGGGRPGLREVDGDLHLLDPETIRELEGRVQLEDPARVAERVSKAAGGAAGLKAMKDQIERIKVQKELIEVIAQWAGIMRKSGYSDRQIHKKYYLHYDKTITETLAEPARHMQDSIDTLRSDFRL